jgi:hypothetical protein
MFFSSFSLLQFWNNIGATDRDDGLASHLHRQAHGDKCERPNGRGNHRTHLGGKPVADMVCLI